MSQFELLAVFALLFVSLKLAHSNERSEAFIGYSEIAGLTTYYIISTHVGEIKIKPLLTTARETNKLIMGLAAKGSCPTCTFYRHEPVPKNWGVDGYWGPPYALLQGGMHDLADTPPWEPTAAVSVKRGHVCIIPHSKDFFIASADHPEWGNSHIVWGQVLDEDSMHVVDQFPVEPYFTRTDNGGITTRWLNTSYAFTLNLAKGASILKKG